MKFNRVKTMIPFFLCAYFIVGCEETEKKTAPPATAPAGLNSYTTQLPDAPGYETFNSNCLSCHSARYVQMQPDLPEKSWTAIVTKMQHSFGAPIPDSSVQEIVQYLVTIKGKN